MDTLTLLQQPHFHLGSHVTQVGCTNKNKNLYWFLIFFLIRPLTMILVPKQKQFTCFPLWFFELSSEEHAPPEPFHQGCN